ncbi:AarF/ABC1/UbiB kinase family protein [Chamaesiphon sp. VAR_48_metabat_135_sub]|uniref:ABC1 kinase family protein n=1 Tax=Chamaesiphon sp. VAR_48_metabat_135_sub TaxID=2964699 RepID=UPI00286C91E2|nr:AarF/ABC1/UbiB kinase family protein [Chamaesiphon sp. VAR_48_metabat_135_sub]
MPPSVVATDRSQPTRFRWQRAKYSPQARQFDIFTAAIGLGLDLLRDFLFPSKNDRYHRRQAQKLVNTAIGLGPTFIKIGQSLSTRVDFFPPIYTETLSQLQDRVPAFSVAEAIRIIESELGANIETLFAEFDEIPIAAASLGQVHRAKLRTGAAVVIKIQRPGLQQLFELDFQVIDRLLWWVDRLLPKKRSMELRAIYQEFFTLLFQEIDYKKEGKNADRFRTNFKTSKLVVAPEIHWKYTTEKVLTMSYLPGIKIDDRVTLEACGFNPKQINQIGICCYLKQLLIDGFFQADPHPGNMAIMADGKLVVYDFGMMAELKHISTDRMIETFWAVMKKDGVAVTDNLIELGLIVRGEDMRPIKRVIDFMLERFTDRPVDVKEFEQIKSEITTLFIQQPFQMSPEMSFIIKALSTLDGIARTLDPNYNLVAAAQPFIRSVAIAERGNIVGKLGKQATSYLKYKLTQPSANELLIKRLEQRLEQSELEISRRSQATDRAIRRVYLAIYNLIYLCLTGFSSISAILLISTHPLWSFSLWIIASLGASIWLRSLINIAIQTAAVDRGRKL